MATFLTWIGWYNVLGAALLAAMHFEPVADFLLRRATEIVAEPYAHGPFGRLWLWWAAAANLFLGAAMVRAASWDIATQREVVVGALGVYAVMFVVLLVGGRGAKFGRGIWITAALWLAQLGWGVASLVG